MIALDYKQTDGTSTLGHRMTNGQLSLAETLRFAMLLGEAVREIHDGGSDCGALQPSKIAITDEGLEVLVAPREQGAITPYTAPEVLQGQAPDSRSDIFAFGAIL